MKVIHKSGMRKTAIARATLRAGSGVVRINSQLLSTLPKNLFRAKIEEPLGLVSDIAKQVNIDVSVHGGGQNAQAEASRVAIAQALAAFNKDLRSIFLEYDRGLLVPDARFKESRKPNRQGKARAKRQKSYR